MESKGENWRVTAMIAAERIVRFRLVVSQRHPTNY
jgi:hypothetical protein